MKQRIKTNSANAFLKEKEKRRRYHESPAMWLLWKEEAEAQELLEIEIEA
jgi:hypothetical protein